MFEPNATGIDAKKNEIKKLEQTLRAEKMRLIHSESKEKSKDYIDTEKKLKEAKIAYEKEAGQPYVEPIVSQNYAGTLYRPRTRTASEESNASKRTVSSETLASTPSSPTSFQS